MALKIVKATTKVIEAVPEVQPEVQTVPVVSVQATTSVEALTVEYLELYKKFDYFEVKQLVKRMDEIRKQLVAVANETVLDAQPAIFSCAQGDVEFSERGKIAGVPNPLALIQTLTEKFGPEVAASVVDIAITPLRKVLSEHELALYLEDQPGHRSIRAVRLAK